MQPPEEGNVRGTAYHPLFDRLAEKADTETLAGASVEPPVVMPVPLSSLPETVASFQEVTKRDAREGEHGC